MAKQRSASCTDVNLVAGPFTALETGGTMAATLFFADRPSCRLLLYRKLYPMNEESQEKFGRKSHFFSKK
jgi:hypothetical protein